MVVGFCSIEDWWDWEGSEMPPGLFQDFIDGYTLWVSSLAVKHSVVVMTEGYESTRSQTESYGSQFSIPILQNLCSEPVEA